eukprot:tig00000430_g600.t1
MAAADTTGNVNDVEAGGVPRQSPHWRKLRLAVRSSSAFVDRKWGHGLFSQGFQHMFLRSATMRTRKAESAAPSETTPLLPAAPAQAGAADAKDEMMHGDATVFQSISNSVNILLGIGVLALPFSLRMAGWSGLLWLVFLGVLMAYTAKLMGRCMLETHCLSYPDLAEAAMGHFGRWMVSAILYFELFSMLVIFIIMEGENLHKIFPEVPLLTFMVGTAVLVLPTAWMRDLSWISYISSVGVVAALTLIGVVLTKAAVVIGVEGTPVGPLLDRTSFVSDWATVPIAFGLMTFSVGGHAVFPSINASMREPEKFDRVVDISYLVVLLAYGAMAGAGYVLFGPKVSPQITLDLTGIYGTLGTCLILIAPLTKFSLNCNPVAFGIEEWFGIGDCEGDRDGSVPASKRAARLAVRTSLVVAALFVAIACPSFGLVVAVVGSFASMAVAAIFPPMLYLGIFRGRLPAWEVALSVFAALVGVAKCGSGLFSHGFQHMFLISADVHVRRRKAEASVPSETTPLLPAAAAFAAGTADADMRPRKAEGTALSETAPLLPAAFAAGAVDTKDEMMHGDATVFQSISNSVNILLGIGVLALPFSLRMAGWSGLLWLVFLGVLMAYTAKLMGRCMLETRFVSYPDLAEAAMGHFGRWMVSAILYFELFSMLVIFIIMEGENLHKIFPEVPLLTFMVGTAVLVLPTAWMRDLSWISYISSVGVVSALTLIGVVLTKAAVVIGVEGTPVGPLLDRTSFVSDWATVPIAFGLMTFSVGGHAVFPSINASMREPEKFDRVVDISYLVVLLAYGAVAGAGYILFGPNVSPQITLDLTGIYGTLGTCLILIAPLTKFSLNCNPVAFGIEEWFGIGDCEGDRDGSVPASKRAARLAVRTSLVVAALFVAIACPSFGLVVAVVGSFASMAVAAIFPPMLYLGIFRGRLPAWEVALSVFAALVGVACAATGTLASLANLS